MGEALKIGITGLPGAGKTYCLLKVIEMLEGDGLKVGGMITEPIVKRNRREGFYVMDWASKEKRVFASREIESKTMVGRYGVDISALEEVARIAAHLGQRRQPVDQRRTAGGGDELELGPRGDHLERLAADRSGGTHERNPRHGHSVPASVPFGDVSKPPLEPYPPDLPEDPEEQDFEAGLTDVIVRDADWASMAHSVEVRVPLVDASLFRAVMRLSQRDRGPSKLDFARTPSVSLPDAVLHRRKTGFSIPVREWLADKNQIQTNERGMRGWALRLLRDASGETLAAV